MKNSIKFQVFILMLIVLLIIYDIFRKDLKGLFLNLMIFYLNIERLNLLKKNKS